MDFRKLIKFGSNSHVISLPRPWLSKNKLEKGAVVYFHENGNNELILTPVAESKAKKEDKEVVIDANGKNIEILRRELISAYMNGYNVIKIVDKNLKDRAIEIRNELQNLMALEVMEQTQTSITTRDLLNLEDLDVSVLIRRMDTIARTMVADLKESIDNGSDQFANLRHRDQDINRIFYVIKRLTNLGISDPNFASQIKTTTKGLFNSWIVASILESVADEVKRISELLINIKLKNNTKKFLFETFSELETNYLSVMRAYYTKDAPLALAYSDKRKDLLKKCNNFFVEVNRYSETNLRVLAINERFKSIIELANGISRIVYDDRTEEKNL